ncbi:tetratricopeptide repeat protein [Pseudenhygromyxa sp. WMMC2535]|uniref:tetratricopeptide repeat protein n=1 Tax=Pseudenhygromyxa sp. WMMC2535 TaxID=2712867 RepID=UPI0015576FD3|nr:tetratricopeptide repeat protein [Pseudenhygromyxa sp. WMMC2535]NVB37838.1 tetratricopeptide repeat protein [Pseudenhygromyxa sp. WMMC2535]
MRRHLTAVFLAAAFLLPACNLTSQARVDSIKAMNEGIQQLNKNNMSGAERAMQESIKKDPTHAEAYLNLGKLYRKQQKWVDAEKAFRGAIENMGEGQRGDYWFELGAVQVAQAAEPGTSRAEQETKWREAITSFSEAIKLNPNLYKAHFQMGKLHEQLDEPEQADQAYRKCIELNGNYSPCFVSLGNMYIDYGFSNVAMVVLETGTKVNETDADMWNGMGRALLNLNKPKEAVDAYKKAKLIDPDKPDVLFGLGMAYAEIPMREEAEKTLNEFMDKAGNSPEHIKKAAQDTIMRMQGPI